MVTGYRYYRALESVIIALALSIALTTRARFESINADSLKLQHLTARKKEWWPATVGSLPQAVTCQHCDRRTHNLPIVSPTLLKSAWD